MMVEARTKDFGLEMDSDKHFEVIEKMDESEVFWEMSYQKNGPGNEIQHGFTLTINPIKFIYEGSFVKSIVNFFRNESDLQIKEQAAEKWVDFKEGAQSQIQESIKAGRKDINIFIHSPILLIPLVNNDPNSELWAVNLGDFSLSSEIPDTNYEFYNFGISSVMIKFYKNYKFWENCAREDILRKKNTKDYELTKDGNLPEATLDPENFTLLEDFQIESNLAVNASGVTQKGRGEVEMSVRASPVKFNINDDLYNHLVNIHRCFTYESPEEVVQNMITEKERVMAKAVVISSVKKRGTNFKLWTKRFAILSGRYLYFYRESNDLVEEENMFLKDAQISELPDKVGEVDAIEIKSKFGHVMMSFTSSFAKETWKAEIQKIVLALSSNVDKDEEVTMKEIEQQQRETNADLFKLELEGPEVRATWLEKDQSKWIVANIKDIQANIKKPVIGFILKVSIGSGLAINHSPIENFTTIATSQKPEGSSGSFIELDIELAEKPENPSGDEINVNVRVGYLMLYYYPPIIKSLVTRIRRIRYLHEYDIEEIKSQYRDRIEHIQHQIVEKVKLSEDEPSKNEVKHAGVTSSSYHCEKFPFPYIIVKVSLSEAEGNFLHHIYATPFIK